MNNTQRGSVLFYILLAVVLLAALSYVIIQSSRGNVSQVTDEKARLLATEIIEYANVMSNAVAQLRLRGINDTDLCFDDPQWGGAPYNNPSCTDDAKKIFHLKGGGVTWTEAPHDAMDSTATPDYLWHIYGDNEVEEIGTTCGGAACVDLILVTDELQQIVCMKINELLKISDPGVIPPTDTLIGITRFVGTFAYDQSIADEAGAAELKGKTGGCFYNTSASKYTFYKVLVAR